MYPLDEMQISSISRDGIVGISGSGKSNTAHTILENLRAQRMPICVLDHKNEYGALPNVKVLTHKTNPEYLVDWLIKTNASVVIQLRKLSLSNKRKWIARFLLSAMRKPRTVPIKIVIEEVRLYCPYDENPASKTPIIDLASGGRSEGYGCLLISQRCAKISKDAFSQLTGMIIHRHSFQTDIKWLSEWLGKEYKDKLPKYVNGQGIYLDLDRGIIKEPIQFPKSEIKKAGHTPEPVAVHERFEAAPKPRASKSSGVDMAGIILIVLLFLGLALGIWVAKKGLDAEEKREHGSDNN